MEGTKINVSDTSGEMAASGAKAARATGELGSHVWPGQSARLLYTLVSSAVLLYGSNGSKHVQRRFETEKEGRLSSST